MAVEPLFVANMDTLKAALRLTDASQADAVAQIDQAVEDVRVRLYDERGLGAALVATLLAIPYTENATTVSALRRTRANNLEIKWVRLLLLKRMPVLFQDASGQSLDAWNEEPLTRLPAWALENMCRALEEEIQDELALLADVEDAGGSMDVVVFEPSETPARPGASIYPSYLSGD